MARQSIQALFEKGVSHAKLGDLNAASKQFRLVLKTNPKVAEAHFQLGRILKTQGKPLEAVKSFASAAKLRPQEPAILAAYAAALEEAGKPEAALTILDRLIALAATATKPVADKGLLLQRLGRFDEAEKVFRAALAANPLDGELYRVFLGTQKLGADDPLIAAMEQAWVNDGLTERTRSHLGFALAKTMEDTGQTDRVFDYLRPANDLQRKAHPYDIRARQEEVASLMQAFADWTPPEIARPTEAAPIFVTGMPRSGTTLIEQILSSHSQVTGAGEVGLALRQAYHLIGVPPKLDLGKATSDALAALGRSYDKALKSRMKTTGRITDKSIQTHLVIGLIRAAIPNARFVIVRRDPRDIGFSIYKNHFADGTHRYANDLRDLGLYQKSFDQITAFWAGKCADVIHEVRYEDMIAEPEAQTRALLAFCGLDWEDACLNFHANTRAVKTLSVHQVRQPIYNSSVGAWQRYEQELQPLIDALEEG